MKKPTFISIVVAICMPIFLLAQTPQFNVKEFAPVGAKWEYFVRTIDRNDYYCAIESIKDTMIQGKRCSKLRSDCFRRVDKKYNYYYFHSTNDKIFVYDNNSFNLLYDFSAKKDDTLTIWRPQNSNCDTNLRAKVDSTKNVVFGDYTYRTYWVSILNCRSWRFIEPIVEHFGNLRFLFPINEVNEVVPEFFQYEDNCSSVIPDLYSKCKPKPRCNNIISYKRECIEVSNNETDNIINTIKIYPNPVSNIVEIYSDEELHSFQLQSIQGDILRKERVYTQKINNLHYVDVSNIPNGIYIFTFYSKKGVVRSKLCITH